MAEPVVKEGAKVGPRSAALPEIVAASKDVSRAAGVLVVTIGVFVLVGWVFDVEALKRVFPGS